MTNSGPLAGVKVIELGGIEPDRTRRRCSPTWVPTWCGYGGRRIADACGGFDLMHRGKRSVDLDVKKEPQALLDRRQGGVVAGLFGPGTCERLGIGPHDCAAVNPRLIFARIDRVGQDGPLAMTAGYDINYLSQMMWTMKSTGRSMRDERESFSPQAGGAPSTTGGAPYYRTYKTSDGKYMAVGAIEPQFFAQLIVGLGLCPMRCQTSSIRRVSRNAQDLHRSICCRTRDEWAAVFRGDDACATPVLTWTDAAQTNTSGSAPRDECQRREQAARRLLVLPHTGRPCRRTAKSRHAHRRDRLVG